VDIAFVCDAMLGGLSRWLRAAGYDAEFEHGIEDSALVARARETGRVLLSSDRGIFERTWVRDGHVRAIFVPRGLDKTAQLRFVLGALGLPLCAPRCMRCSGALARLAKEEAAGEAPARTYASVDDFFRCTRCGQLFWYGTHWERISRTLAEAASGHDAVREG
jgi:hypothetical protein